MSDKRNRNKRLRLSSEGSDSSSMSSFTSSSSSSDEEKDPKDLKPIKDYLNDRKEMAAQLFKSVKAEKIRMMLPQLLKKVDFNDLEELCAAELTGMSKSRILSILDGKEMLESSATNDSDDSGPSLEIISDTEWLSEGEPNVKKEGSKNNKNSKKMKKKKQENKSKLKSKEKGAEKKSGVKVKLEKVKAERKDKEKDKKKDKDKEKDKSKDKEKEKEKEKEKKQLPKEGTGSLLDLLELEMRARAIRALIRKEEDSSTSKTKKDSATAPAEAGTSNEDGSKARQASLKEQLEKIDVLMKHGEEDDIYVVINPAPTIDLLSSDSEGESNTKRRNKKLLSEKASVSELQLEKTVENSKEVETINTSVSNGEKDKKEESSSQLEEQKTESKNKENDKNQTENLNLPITAIEVNENKEKSTVPKEKSPPEELEDGEIVEDESEKPNEPTASTSDTSIKKVKKNPNLRSKKKQIDEPETKNSEKPIEIEDSPERQVSKEPELIKVAAPADDYDDDKTLDIEEIINLDDYPDDEPEEPVPSKEPPPTVEKTDDNDNSLENQDQSETWASRYIQQDGVQNVIKESKIQSEIRKRLRERQRQSKLNNSPKLDEQETSQDAVTEKPTGSVEEYLALKGIGQEVVENEPETEVTETPVVIVKKPQLNVKILSIEKVDPVNQIFAVERLNEIVKTSESLFKNSEEEGVKDEPSVEESAPIGSSSPIKQPVDLNESAQSLEEKSREDELTSRSDSSDDNIIVKIDNISSSDRRQEDQ